MQGKEKGEKGGEGSIREGRVREGRGGDGKEGEERGGKEINATHK